MLEKKQLEEVSEEQLEIEKYDQSIPVHYLTHFPIDQVKFRVVYHGALQFKGLCINDLLYKGPTFLSPLVAVLMRFREGKYAVIGDIKSMYFQIKLDPKDRDMARVLWYEGPGMDGPIKHYRFTVMPWGVKTVASIAGYSIEHTLTKKLPSGTPMDCKCIEKQSLC